VQFFFNAPALFYNASKFPLAHQGLSAAMIVSPRGTYPTLLQLLLRSTFARHRDATALFW
jgi:hypothetical protein